MIVFKEARLWIVGTIIDSA